MRTLDVDEDAAQAGVASSEDDSRFSGTMLLVNGILVAVAAIVAIVVLVAVLTR